MPAIHEHLVDYFEGWNYLHRRRPSGMGGPQPLSQEAIHSFIVMMEIEQYGEWLRWLDFLDDVYMTWVADELEKRNKKK